MRGIRAAATATTVSKSRQKKTTRILFVNRALAERHGFEPEELIGTEPERLVSVDECSEQYSELIEAMRAGKPARVQLRSRRRNGTSFWAGMAMGPVRDDSGRVTHFVSMSSYRT